MVKCKRCGMLEFDRKPTCASCGYDGEWDADVAPDDLTGALKYIATSDWDALADREATLCYLSDLLPSAQGLRSQIRCAYECGAVSLLVERNGINLSNNARGRMESAYMSDRAIAIVLEAFCGALGLSVEMPSRSFSAESSTAKSDKDAMFAEEQAKKEVMQSLVNAMSALVQRKDKDTVLETAEESAAHPDTQPGSPEQVAAVVSVAFDSERHLQPPSVPRIRDVAASKGVPFDLGKVRKDFAEANDYFWGEHGKPVDYVQAGLRYERVINSVAGDDMSATAKLRLGIIYATGADRYYPKDHDAAKLYLKAAIDECGAEQDRRLAKAHYARILEAEDSIGVKEAQIAQLYTDALAGGALEDELTDDAAYYLGRYHLGKTGIFMSWGCDPEDYPVKKDPALGRQYLRWLMIRLPGGHEKIPLVRALLEYDGTWACNT